MNRKAKRLETLIIRVSLWLLVFFGAVSVVAIALVAQHGRSTDAYLRMAIPISVIFSCGLAFALLKRGWARSGVAIVVVTAYLAIVNYIVVGGYGLHSYLLSIFAVLIVITSLLIGRRAGLWAALTAVATAGMLFALESAGHMVDQEAVASIPLNNILVVYCILFASIGSVQYAYSKVFQETLRAADEQELRFRQVLDVAPLGHVVHRDGRVLMINQVAASITGRAAEALAGMEIEAFVAPDQRARLKQNMNAARSLPAGQNVAAEYLIRDSKRRERLYETLTAPLDFVNGPALLSVLRDVTRERAAAAALLEAKAEADAANRTKSQFLANMSHEIRTPMNAVLGLSELLLDSGLTGTQLRFARNIHNASGSLLDIINDVLDVSRIEAGHFELARAPLEPRNLVVRVRAMLLPLAEAKGLELAAEVDASVPPTLMGDEGRIRQILVNLAGNAIKFTEQGRVTIALRGEPASAAGTARLRMLVSDSGVGIAPEKLSTLFKPFVQVDNSDTRRHGGTGLGLYIVRELAQRMGGEVGVHSKPATGSTFEVVLQLDLPTTAVAPTLAPPRSGPALAGTGALTVLLVEDNEINRMVACAVLEGAGHQVIEAADGAQALASYATRAFDCVLMDCQMPVMDGLEAAHRMRAHEAAHGRPRTPIVALTANTMQGDRERCLAAGMDDFLAKPYAGAALLDVLKRMTALENAE